MLDYQVCICFAMLFISSIAEDFLSPLCMLELCIEKHEQFIAIWKKRGTKLLTLVSFMLFRAMALQINMKNYKQRRA